MQCCKLSMPVGMLNLFLTTSNQKNIGTERFKPMNMKNRVQEFYENFSLSKKSAIIMGASSGIGLESAKMFARKGADMFLFDLQSSEDAEPVRYAKEQQVRCCCHTGDITRKEDIKTAVQQAIQQYKKIDILVNCAGVGILESVHESTEQVWDRTLAANLTGPVMMALEVCREMKGSGGGSVVNIASQAGVVALENHLAYGTSKAGLIHATKQLALEYGRYEINIDAISPTVILTPMGEMNWNNKEGEAFKNQIPLKRFGYPAEVAACAVFLASDAARLFSGTNLIMDGGYTIA